MRVFAFPEQGATFGNKGEGLVIACQKEPALYGHGPLPGIDLDTPLFLVVSV